MPAIDTTDNAADLDLLIAAAHAAGELASRHWHGARESWEKDDGSGPVTQADLDVDALLAKTLRAARPAYGWMSEESLDDGSRLSAQRCFVVDPIDGTRSFAAGEKTWSHALAIVENGQTTAGVVYLPLKDRMYAATLGGGATLNGEPIQVSDAVDPSASTVLASRPTLDPQNWSGVVPKLQRHFRPSIAYRLALVAQGRFDAMIAFRDSWEWDIAAGSLIAEEAGATVSDGLGRALNLNSPDRRSTGIIVAPPALHAALLSHRRFTRQSA